MPQLKAVILAGGPSKGTRFRPLSFDQPKALFELAGKPLIYHHVAAVSQLVPDLTEILLIGFYASNLFDAFVADASKEFNVPIRYLQEEIELGTAGGLYKFKDEIMSGLDGDSLFFVLHCDVICEFPLREMIDFHLQRPESRCTLLTKKVDKDLTKNYGVVYSQGDTGLITHYAEKPETFVNDLINCGAYLFSPQIFSTIESLALAGRQRRLTNEFYDLNSDESSGSVLLPNGDIRLRLEQDVFRKLATERSKEKIYSFETRNQWIQVKHAGACLDALGLLLEVYKRKDTIVLTESKEDGPTIVGRVYIHPTARVDPSAKLGPNVLISENAVIEAGVRVRNSIVLANVLIKKRACVINSIIGWNSKISQWSRVEGELDPNPNSKSGGVSIIGSDVTIGPEIYMRNVIVLPHKEVNQSCHDDILL